MEPSRERELIELALTIREVEETLLQLFQAGEISGTVHTCVGQEFTGVSVCTQLKKNDFVFSNHRGHGHFLAFTRNIRGLFAELMGKKDGVCGGLGGSQHLCHEGFYSNGIQGGIVPVSLGLALAKKIKNENNIGVVFLGDGTLGEGTVYEGLNIASLWNLPLLFVLEDNGIAQSTLTKETTAGSIPARAEAFGIRTFEGSTDQWLQLCETSTEAIKFVREGKKPAFLHIQTSRLRAHSKGDDTRGEREIEAARKRDFLMSYAKMPEGEALVKKVKAKVFEELSLAKKSPPAVLPKIEEISTSVNWKSVSLDGEAYVGKSLQQSFQKLMSSDEKILFVGEDVKSPYGGAFKIAQNLSNLFPSQVFSTPISEASLVGIGTGLSMENFKPFVEIMFGDFLSLGFDQLVNHAAKFAQMYNQQVSVDVVVRTPMGGRRGYGPTHSQSLEKHFLGVPGLRVLALNNLQQPHTVLNALASGKSGPTLLIENKVGYTQALGQSISTGFEVLTSSDKFPATVVRPRSSRIDVTIFCYGAMADEATRAAEILFKEDEIFCQILVPTQIYPFQIETFKEFLSSASDFVSVEEGSGFSSLTSEVLAQLSVLNLGLKTNRLSAPDICIPSASPLEKEILPGFEAIRNFIKKLKS